MTTRDAPPPNGDSAATAATAARFDTRQGFRDALCRAMDDAIAQEVAELRWIDPDFGTWPLDDAGLRSLLARWCRRGRRLTLFAHGFDVVQRRHPRFVAWRRLQTHVVSGRALGVEPSEIPTLFLGGMGRGIVVFDRDRHVGRELLGPSDWLTWSDVADALMQQSCEAFAATTLGI